ncbi:MAG: pirin family protein [Saprospirales bacterium]|nr:MAG: pirin family protein [Saprospirales bacterium]
MKSIIHRAEDRGFTQIGWLNSAHSFSFGGFYNPEKMGFGALRVLNDDIVSPGAGFAKHPHDNMEIVSIPLSGDLEHNDSTGTQGIIKSGDVQIMTAGFGIRHSEKNANADKEVAFLQIWVFPNSRDLNPAYDQKSFDLERDKNNWVTVVDPNGKDGVKINQQSWFSMAVTEANQLMKIKTNKENNGLYLFVIEGSFKLAENVLKKRDAIGIWDLNGEVLQLRTNEPSQLLLIEVPMA